MYYEINVSIKGQHYFATASRSIRDEEKAQQIAKELKTFYSAQYENVGVSIAYRETSGRDIPLTEEA